MNATDAKILVVDDDWAILELLRIQFSKRGYGVVTARNAKEFWKQAFEEKPDLVVLDIWLGEEGGGTNVYEEIITRGFDPEVPVIFMSALVEEGTPAKHAPEGGRFALYGKPFDFNQMLDEVQNLLHTRIKKRGGYDESRHPSEKKSSNGRIDLGDFND